MLRRLVPLAVLATVIACALPAAASAADPPAVPAGVSAGGVDLSGLSLVDAQARLRAVVEPRFAVPLTLGAAGRPWVIPIDVSRMYFDSLTTAKRALRAKVAGEVPLKLSHSRAAVRDWVADVAAEVLRRPRNARLTIGLRHMQVRTHKNGLKLDQAAVEAQVNAALDDPAAPRRLHTALVLARASVTLGVLKQRYATIITVDKANFRLRLFKRLKFSKSYGVAVGQPAYPTPSGRFSIANKQVDPVWSVPNSPWAGELQGTTVEGGTAANPLKARWMGIINGVGIHGTGEEGSIGSRASHGCIRMRVADVKDLFDRVPVGTPVLIR